METIMSELEIFKNLLLQHHLLKKHNIKKIGIFGSFARGEKNANDIDILIETAGNYKALIDFKEELEKLVNKKIDIVIDKYANPIVLYRAKKEIIYVSEY